MYGQDEYMHRPDCRHVCPDSNKWSTTWDTPSSQLANDPKEAHSSKLQRTRIACTLIDVA
jgi:hypothetical protein